MEDKLTKAIIQAAGDYGLDPNEVEISYPDENFGDYATNVALKLASRVGGSPREIAQILANKLRQIMPELSRVDIAGPGFINVRLSDRALIDLMDSEPAKPLSGKVIVTEFSDPNPFKLLHVGHLYTSIIGDAMSNLLEVSGASVFRVNYGGDVGLHVGKTMWAMLKQLGGENPQELAKIAHRERGEWMSRAYVAGNKAYDEDGRAKQEINDLNRRIYQIQAEKDKQSPLAQIYWTTRQWSYDALNDFYSKLNIKFDRYYPESQTAPIGIKTVNEQLVRGVFERSDGAVVFKGEKYGLHTRVFITDAGLPTYEAKELGLAELKQQDYGYDQSIIITGNEQEQYMAVVLKALEQFAPELAQNTAHLTHGMVRLAGGKKMSSRAGNFLGADEVLEVASEAAIEVSSKADQKVILAAVKYSMLKQRLGGDIIFVPEESVSILGNSGPYLQYAHARARSILSKAGYTGSKETTKIDEMERSLTLKLSRYSSVVNQAVDELSPHILCTYLYETAQAFNRFYESNRVIGDEKQSFRLALVKTYADRLKDGLGLLGIEAPERL